MPAPLELVIGTQNYSSWSLRPWIALRNAGIPFTTRVVPVLGKGVNFAVHGSYSPSGLVPVLNDGENKATVWDSLAIVEYAHELFPEAGVWPRDRAARARARCVAAEMHAGFADLRTACPMNVKHVWAGGVPVLPAGAMANIARIEGIWASLRGEFGSVAVGAEAGPYLFGRFTAADAFYAPVVFRFLSYGVVLSDPLASTYMDAVAADEGMKEWREAALKEEAQGMAIAHYDEAAAKVGR
jgi:glutathione S-transferase